MGKHITKSDRLEISILLKKGHSLREIAAALKKSHSSLSREIRRNSTNVIYDPLKAQAKSRHRRKQSKYQGMKIRGNRELEKYVSVGLHQYWTPEEIAGKLRTLHGHTIVSHNAIYKYLYSASGQHLCQYLPSQRYRRKPRKDKQDRKEIIKDRIFIDLRPAIINNRERFGDWEADLLGQPQYTTGAIAGVEERLSRKLLLSKQTGHSHAMNGFKQMLHPHRHLSHSITLDNGTENVSYKQLELSAYFCHPYSFWEKGGIENSFQRLRRFIPKKSSPMLYTQHDLDAIMEIMNNTPRKCLGYKTPNEVFNEHVNLLGGAFEG